MPTNCYLISVNRLPMIMKKIVEGTAPQKFTMRHLKSIGFASTNDRQVIKLLKELKFLSADGTPTQRYHDYRNTSRSRVVMAEALHDAYSEIFHINETPGPGDKTAIEGHFKSVHNTTKIVSHLQMRTFYELLKLADLDASPTSPTALEEQPSGEETPLPNDNLPIPQSRTISLRYNIEIHLPSTSDIGVYNAIFKALREHFDD